MSYSMAVGYRAIAVFLVVQAQCFTKDIEGGKSSVQSPLDTCVADIIQAYGSADLRDILVEILKEWKPLAADAVTHWTKQWFFTNRNHLCMQCREDRNCKQFLDKFETKRNIKDVIKSLYGSTIVKNFAVKIGISGVKIITGHVVGLAADIAQFALEYYGYTTAGIMVGAVGNTISGSMVGFFLTGHPIGAIVGGFLGFGVWIYSETELNSNPTEIISSAFKVEITERYIDSRHRNIPPSIHTYKSLTTKGQPLHLDSLDHIISIIYFVAFLSLIVCVRFTVAHL